MTEKDLLAEIKKGIDFHLDGTWNIKDLYSHFQQVIGEEVAAHEIHKNRLEKFMYKVEEMRLSQCAVRSKHLSELPACKVLEKGIDVTISNFKLLGYNSDRFRPNTNQQNSMFNT